MKKYLKNATKSELSTYLSELYFIIEREQTSEPSTAKGLREAIKALKARCRELDLMIPSFSDTILIKERERNVY